MADSGKIQITIDADLKDIMPTFLSNRIKDLSSILEAIKTNDIKTIQVIGHKLAGNAGSYGLPDLGQIGVNLEMAAIKQDLISIKSLLIEYKNYMEKLEIVYK